MEIVILAEKVLRHLRTLGELKQFVTAKLSVAPSSHE